MHMPAFGCLRVLKVTAKGKTCPRISLLFLPPCLENQANRLLINLLIGTKRLSVIYHVRFVYICSQSPPLFLNFTTSVTNGRNILSFIRKV